VDSGFNVLASTGSIMRQWAEVWEWRRFLDDCVI